MSTEPQNVCAFKKACQNCKKVAMSDRPTICYAIKCEEYVPCPKCQMNRKLHQTSKGMFCKTCIAGDKELLKDYNKLLKGHKLGGLESIVIRSDASESQGQQDVTTAPVSHDRKRVSITIPGNPPPELTTSEITYYNTRWEEFKGYYRDPAAYFSCHMLILLEIHISYLNSQLIEARGELNAEITKELQQNIQTLNQLKNQLPEKEAEEVMDDDKALSRIYDAYTKEVKAKSIGKVSRLLSPAAIALAPKLEFPLSAEKLMRKLGFRTVTIEELLPRIKQAPVDRTPEEILEFFGFHLDEEFAMDQDSPLMDSEEILANLGLDDLENVETNDPPVNESGAI